MLDRRAPAVARQRPELLPEECDVDHESRPVQRLRRAEDLARPAATLAVRRLGAFVLLGLIAAGNVLYSMNFRDGDIDRYYLLSTLVACVFVGVAVGSLAFAKPAGATCSMSSTRPGAGADGRSMPISATAEPIARFGMIAARRSVSVAKRNAVLARRVPQRPPTPMSSFSPEGVQRTTDPFVVNKQAVAAIRCS